MKNNVKSLVSVFLGALFLSVLLYAQTKSHLSEKLTNDPKSDGLFLPPITVFKGKYIQEKGIQGIDLQQNYKKYSEQLQNADLVFIRSTSSQSRALEEVTGSTWTHVGILFYVQSKKGIYTLLEENSAYGTWQVLEAGARVQFTPLKDFVSKKEFQVLRLKAFEDRQLKVQKLPILFQSGIKRLGLKYDIYFRLTDEIIPKNANIEGLVKDNSEYCSELVWYVFTKAGYVLGELNQMSSLLEKNKGPETEKIIKQRFKNANPPQEWLRSWVIPPQSQYDSALLKKVSF